MWLIMTAMQVVDNANVIGPGPFVVLFVWTIYKIAKHYGNKFTDKKPKIENRNQFFNQNLASISNI